MGEYKILSGHISDVQKTLNHWKHSYHLTFLCYQFVMEDGKPKIFLIIFREPKLIPTPVKNQPSSINASPMNCETERARGRINMSNMFVEPEMLKDALPWMEYQPSWNILDASKTQRFMECPRAYFYEYILGWRSDRPNNHLIFGESWHQAMEHLLLHGYGWDSVMQAFEVFLKEYRSTFPEDTDEVFAPKTPLNASKALTKYVKNYEHDDFDVIYTEIGGQVSINDKYHLTFRMDGLCFNPLKKCYFVLEHKTSSSISRQWSDQWALSFQVGTYTHALHCMFPEESVTGVVVNGTCFQKRDIKFMRIPIYKSLSNMNAWLADALFWTESIHKEFKILASCRDSDNVMFAFPRNPTTCTKYSGCPYHDFCCTWANPLQRADEVPMGMVEDHWNPLDRELKEKVELQLPSEEV